MNRTTNYKLCQWEADDKVQRTDFNADNAKLDAAIKAVAQRAAALETGKADKAQCLRIITGSFTGTGSADPVHISIGARPRLLLIATNNTIGNSNERARFVTENGINVWFSHQNTEKNADSPIFRRGLFLGAQAFAAVFSRGGGECGL